MAGESPAVAKDVVPDDPQREKAEDSKGHVNQLPEEWNAAHERFD